MKLNDLITYRLYLNIANNMLFDGVEDLQPALEAVNKAERLVTVPPDAEIYALYGSLYYTLNQREEAAKYFEDYLRQNPNDLSIRRQLTLVYSEIPDHQNALRVFQPVMETPNPSVNDIVTFYRLLITNGYSWDQIFPVVKMAIELKGKEVIDPHIIGTDLSAPWAEMFLNDPRMVELVGPDYARFFQVKPASRPLAGTEPILVPDQINSMPDAYEFPVEPDEEETPLPAVIQPGASTTLDRGDVDQAADVSVDSTSTEVPENPTNTITAELLESATNDTANDAVNDDAVNDNVVNDATDQDP